MKKELTGTQIDSLRILKKVGVNNDRKILYECECVCGKKCIKTSRYLLGRTKIKSCGCANGTDIKNNRYGMLTAIERTNRRKYGRIIWKFQCDCGNMIEYPAGYVISGNVWNCGCEKKENIGFNIAREKLCIFGTNIEAIKSKKLSKNNKSGVTGVCWSSQHKKWLAYITFQGYRQNLGMYKDKNEAIKSRKNGEQKREMFIEWYDSLDDHDKEYYINKYKNEREFYKKFLQKIKEDC